jgi:hypothetical protein
VGILGGEPRVERGDSPDLVGGNLQLGDAGQDDRGAEKVPDPLRSGQAALLGTQDLASGHHTGSRAEHGPVLVGPLNEERHAEFLSWSLPP